MPPLELLTLWAAIIGYAVASAVLIVGLALARPVAVSAAVGITCGALVAHAVALGARWLRVGHGPAVGFFEVASGLAFLAVLAFVVLALRQPGVRPAGAIVLPLGFLILGSTLLVNAEARAAGGSLASVWLVIHVLFANLAFGCYAASFVLAVGELLRCSRLATRLDGWLSRPPAASELEGLTYRIVGAAFVFQGIMIASGAVWANEAWGRYWAFDPIESWSLLAWLVLALHLHATLTLGWRGARAAWVIVLGFAVVTFSLLGVPVVYDSIHAAYLSL